MIDLQIINQAIYDTLKQVTTPDTKYILVLWSSDDNRACISSNELDERRVRNMLAGAAGVVASSKPHDYMVIDDEPAGHA